MKKAVFALAIFMSLPALAEDSSVVKDSIKSTVSGVIAAGKDALSGVKDGVDDGRQSGSSIDGAVIVTDKENLTKYVTVSVLSAEKVANQEYKLTLALRNNTDKIVRLSNLNESKSLILIDKDGFISSLKTPLTPGEFDITIPENAGVKQRYVFGGVEDVPATLRLYGMDIAVPAPAAK
ncbi:hypothetical protein I2492_04995 [Budviciaceae bacterium CWB-B4]|uniref:DUF4352 domain-containing protein n=1 Tax=Limnobaculum xujianqingii TaxID=2738837 RepID=A0A9D7AGP2_9GAMM|nr:hypothetical protein [Limnobaculum xujianqingii]MBK5072372.1 hypothetical protein [Limnobaculum xujianqingii]MBK5175681.1 hypothetical protein [Limnobaculum xujianqingii]